MREYKRKFKEFNKLKSLRTQMEKLRLIASQIIRREKLKLRLCVAEQHVFEKNVEPIELFLKQTPLPKGRPPENKKKIVRIFKKKKRLFSKKIKKPAQPLPLLKKKRQYIKKTGINSADAAGKPKYLARKMMFLKLKEKNKMRRNKLLKLIRKTTKKLIPEENIPNKNQENPNEPRDNLLNGEESKKPQKMLRCELKGLVRTQNSKELSLFMEISKKSAMSRKVLRSRNVKGKLRSNKMYRYNV